MTSMKISRRFLICGLAAVGVSLMMPLGADDALTPDEKRAQWESMSQEERRALMEERRAEFEAMTPEEQEAARREHRAMREERRARFESLSPEEKQAIREQRRARWEAMTPEQRADARQHMQRRAGDHPGRGHRGGQRGSKGGNTDDGNQ